MANGGEKPAPTRMNIWVWLARIGTVIAFVLFLQRFFPGQFSQNPILVFVFAPIFLVIAVIAETAVRYYYEGQMPFTSKLLIWFAFGLFVFLAVALVFCVLFGKPVDLRHLLNPALVARQTYPDDTITLKPGFATTELLSKYAEPETGVDEKTAEQMGKWLEWLMTGNPQSDKEKLIVYTSRTFDSFYWPFDGTIKFDKPSNANLAEGVAFLRHKNERGDILFRQLKLWIDESNVDHKAGKQNNSLTDVEINLLDEALFVLSFVSADDKPLSNSLSDWKTSIEVGTHTNEQSKGDAND